MKQKRQSLYQEDQVLNELLKEADMQFRTGFSRRLITRLTHILEESPARKYYAYLSSFLPKMLYFSAIILVIILFAFYLSYDEMNFEGFMGLQKTDENNFISYLILHKN